MKTIKYIPILTIYFTIQFVLNSVTLHPSCFQWTDQYRTIDDNENGIDTVKMPAIRSSTEAMAQGNNRFDISSSLMVTKN